MQSMVQHVAPDSCLCRRCGALDVCYAEMLLQVFLLEPSFFLFKFVVSVHNPGKTTPSTEPVLRPYIYIYICLYMLCLSLLDPLDAAAEKERERERERYMYYMYKPSRGW